MNISVGHGRIYAVRRAEAHGIKLACDDISHLEETILRMQPVFVRPDTDQYFLTVQFRKARFAVLFNTRLGSIVTIGRARPLVSGPAICTCEAVRKP